MSHWSETQEEWTSQPQVPVKATSNPIKWDRVWDLGQFREAASNKALTNTGTTPSYSGEVGRNIGGTSQSDDTHHINTGASIAGHGITNSFTFILRVSFASNGWNMVACGDESSAADDGAIQFFRLVGGDLVFRTSDSGGTAKDINLTGGGVLNKLLTVVMKYDGANVKAWMNGSYVGSVAMTGNVRSTTSNFFLGKRGAAGVSYTYPLDGWISLAALSKQAAPDSYAAELSRNPWPIFEPEDDTIWGASAGGGVNLNQTTETDTAQPVGKAKYKAIGQASTTDAAQAITAARRVAVGQASETDSAQAVTSGKVLTLGQATETDAAQAITEAGSITAAVGQVAETDLAQAVASSKLKAIGQASESDSAQAVSAGRVKAIGQTTETDSAQAFAVSKTVAVGQASETGLAQPITHIGTKTIALGMVSETDFAQAVAAYKRIGILQPVETDSAHSISVAKRVGVGQISETDAAQAIAVSGGSELLTVDLVTAPSRTTLVTAPSRTTLVTAPSRTTLIESRHAIHG